MKRFAANVVLASSAGLMTVRADLTIFHDTTAYDTVRRFLNDPLASCDQVNRTTRYLYADDISGDHFGLEGEKVMVVGAAKEVAANTRFGHFSTHTLPPLTFRKSVSIREEGQVKESRISSFWHMICHLTASRLSQPQLRRLR